MVDSVPTTLMQANLGAFENKSRSENENEESVEPNNDLYANRDYKAISSMI